MSENRTVKAWVKPAIFQALIGIAIWMTFGLLLEGFIGYKTPMYLQDSLRRELFRLAHAHGTLLSGLLLGVTLAADRLELDPSKLVLWALRIGVVTLPLGFLFGGVWHFESDPGMGVWLVPASAVLVIFGLVGVAMSLRKP
jgi:hypothetical protein